MTLAQAIRTPLRSSLCALAVTAAALAGGTGDARADGTVVISQLFGGGGNNGSDYTNDFIELMNRSVAPVDITGWTVQYAAATGSTWTSTPLSGTIPPGGYFLIQEGSGGLGTTPLPAPDASGSINMSATGGKCALVRDATLLSGICPKADPAVEDFVGYNDATVNCWEGYDGAVSPSVINSIQRYSQGCQDNDQNFFDFFVAVANPRNSAYPPNECHVVAVDALTWGALKSIYR